MDAARVGPCAKHGRGHDRSDAGLGEKVWTPGPHDDQDRLAHPRADGPRQWPVASEQGLGAAHARDVDVGLGPGAVERRAEGHDRLDVVGVRGSPVQGQHAPHRVAGHDGASTPQPERAQTRVESGDVG